MEKKLKNDLHEPMHNYFGGFFIIIYYAFQI